MAHPQLSALLSGTPRQVQSLIPDAENGLFSRFLFYYINLQPVWKNVFAGNENAPLEYQFDKIASNFQTLFHHLQQQPVRLRFALSAQQQEQFNAYFDTTQQYYHSQFGDSFIGTVRRLGLSTFRVAMILTTLRITDVPSVPNVLICNDTDFNTALTQLAMHKFASISYIVNYIFSDSFMGDYSFFSHFRICLLKF